MCYCLGSRAGIAFEWISFVDSAVGVGGERESKRRNQSKRIITLKGVAARWKWRLPSSLVYAAAAARQVESSRHAPLLVRLKKKTTKKQTNKTNRVHLQSKVSPGYSNSNEIESVILFFYSIEALEQFFFLLVVEGLERGRDQQSEGYRVFFVLNDVKMVKKRNKKKEGKVC